MSWLSNPLLLILQRLGHPPPSPPSPVPPSLHPCWPGPRPRQPFFPTQFVTLLSTPRDTEEISHLRDQADWCPSHSHQTVPSTPTSPAGSNPSDSKPEPPGGLKARRTTHRMCTPHLWPPPHSDPTQTPTQPYLTHHSAIRSSPSRGICSLHP